jgi:uncharacterized membrane protein YgdD (TMEM256/DUF423 family)
MSRARALVVAGALVGFLGVMLSALARHRPGTMYLETAAQFLLFHGPALFGLAALLRTGVVRPGIAAAAGLGLVIGLGLFCGDLAARDFLDRPLFSMAAPTGGSVLMAGWLLIGVAGLWRMRPQD